MKAASVDGTVETSHETPGEVPVLWEAIDYPEYVKKQLGRPKLLSIYNPTKHLDASGPLAPVDF